MSNQWLLDEDRLRWPIALSCDVHAVLALDEDNQPVRWEGICFEYQIPLMVKHIEASGYDAKVIPLRVNLPDVFCDLNLFRMSATADVELEQASFSIVQAPRPRQSSARPRKQRRANG